MRTGLDAEVPTLWGMGCYEMAKNPILANAFKNSSLVWGVHQKVTTESGMPVIQEQEPELIERRLLSGSREMWSPNWPAPTVREMLAWLDKQAVFCTKFVQHQVGGISIGQNTFPVYDPDSLARACIEAAK